MRKLFKKLSVLSVAAVLAAGAISLTACDQSVSIAADTSATAQTVTSNGGFVVTTGDYYYFINGIEAHTVDNTYGKVVKASLMRQKKSALKEGKNESEIVVPSLISSSDYTSGIYIYGEGASARVYYATPNNVKNTSGETESDYLDFKSTKLDGSDTQNYFRVSDNATIFRFVEVEGTVYVLYVENSNLHSYNTKTNTDTLLVRSMSAYAFNSVNKDDPYVYYTMSVQGWVDTDSPKTFKYNQLYRVRADATASPYDYEFDQNWIDEKNDGEVPYVNCGTIVLDGIGSSSTDEKFDTRFSPDYSSDVKLPTMGYSYTLQSYTNDGVYFTRSLIESSSDGLFYLPVSALTDGWNSIEGNALYEGAGSAGKIEVVANSVNASNAGTAALFYIDENSQANTKHHYLYVNDKFIYRADVINDGKGANVQYGASGDLRIAFNESGATLVSIDAESDSAYQYLYYTKTSGSGKSVNRVPYNGTSDNYTNLSFGTDADKHANDAYETVSVAAVQHANTWYNYEIIDNTLFYANTETIGSTSFNYIYTVDLANSAGKLMNNVELSEVSDNYDLIMGADGYIETVAKDHSSLSNPLKYYFYTGKKDQFWTNIQNAVDLGKKETYLFSEEEQDIFKAFSEGGEIDKAELNGEGVKYRLQSEFITFIGLKSEADIETEESYWETAIANYQAPAEEGGLVWWAWLLIGVGIAAVVAGAVVTTVLLLRKNKAQDAKPAHKMAVDTTDDKSIDVYGTGEEEAPAEENAEAEGEPAPAEDTQEAAQETPEENTEAPVEEPVEAVAEAPAEAPAEETAEEDGKSE